MASLGEMLLVAMGWNNSHSHVFRVGERNIGPAFDDLDDEDHDDQTAEGDITVVEALREVGRCSLEYDFGDGWVHEVTVESLVWSPTALKFAVCLDGQNACPPDDIGGPSGFSEFLEALAEPMHDDHRSYLEWIGFPYDPKRFDLVNTNALLQRVR